MSERIDPRVYGFVNGEPVYSAEEFVYKCRGFGEIESDEDLIEYARKRTGDWSDSGWRRGFLGYYLSDYALSEPKNSLTSSEFERLKALQEEARAEWERQEEARKWRLIRTEYFADNSEEEVWEDKDGVQKRVMTVAPHGDACY